VKRIEVARQLCGRRIAMMSPALTGFPSAQRISTISPGSVLRTVGHARLYLDEGSAALL